MASALDGTAILVQQRGESVEQFQRRVAAQVSGLERRFRDLLYAMAPELASPTAEFRAVKTRKYRWDLAWEAERVLVEVQGGTWNAGAHGRGSGIERDAEKANAAACAGYRVLYFTSSMIRKDPSGCVETVRRALVGGRT